MSTLLYVKSSIFGDHGQSSQLADAFINEWKEQNTNASVIVRDLNAEPVPHLDGERIGGLFSEEGKRSDAQQAVVDYADALLAEVQQADQILLTAPMYNFGVPSSLKAYFDHLARVGVTFKYTETGPVGLLEDTPVTIVTTRGGLYKDSGIDFQLPFVKQFLGFIGLHNTQVIYAEGLSMEGKEDAFAAAKAELVSSV